MHVQQTDAINMQIENCKKLREGKVCTVYRQNKAITEIETWEETLLPFKNTHFIPKDSGSKLFLLWRIKNDPQKRNLLM